MIKTFPVTLDRERTLRYDLNAFALIEEHPDVPMDSVRGVRLLLWAGLKHEDPDLSLEDVGAMISPAQLPDITEAVGKAMADAQAPAKAGPQKAQGSRPKRSGP